MRDAPVSVIWLWLLVFGSRALAQPVPLIHAHAHNDYEHPHPLTDALACGFCSVEADIHLVGNDLLVAHDLSEAKPERNLQALYLESLRERVRKNGGHVYPSGPEFTLLVDLKTDWKLTHPVLRSVLQHYSDMLTTFPSHGLKKTNAIIVILTGNRSKEMFQGESVRLAAFDGTLADLDGDDPPALIPWISSDWWKNFNWNGRGTIPDLEKEKLKSMVAKAHLAGRQIRFWDAPDQPVFWQEMLNDGVDLINTDNLTGLQKFLTSR